MEFTTKENGAKVVLAPCSFEDAFRLKSKIEKALLENGIKIEQAFDEDLGQLVLVLDSSEEVFNCLFDCLRKSTYNDVRITKEIFEDPDARADFYEIFFNCLKVNIYPFIKALLSRYNIQLKVPTIGENQKSK